jgi:anti-anti-sigma regulatory factor
MQVSEAAGVLTLTLTDREDAPDRTGYTGLLEALTRVNAVAVEAGACQRIGTLGLQMLVALGQAADAAGIDFRLTAPGEGFAEAATDLGLGPWMSARRGDA